MLTDGDCATVLWYGDCVGILERVISTTDEELDHWHLGQALGGAKG